MYNYIYIIIYSITYHLLPDNSVSLCRTHCSIAVGYGEYVMNAQLIHIGAGVQGCALVHPKLCAYGIRLHAGS
jgi:hypothetical protein